jgi:hypothetical protein
MFFMPEHQLFPAQDYPWLSLVLSLHVSEFLSIKSKLRIHNMRIWSIHPEHIDTKGLVALWREALLAKHVLAGKTKGYKNHPQLIRFKNAENPVGCINQYLSIVYSEAVKRGYNFDKTKIDWDFTSVKLKVTKGQLEFEKRHLLNKLKIRDMDKYKTLISIDSLTIHPLFELVNGPVEEWEKTDKNPVKK